jgi:hypothetical protein
LPNFRPLFDIYVGEVADLFQDEEARTLGTCSHITSVIKYLSYDRYQPEKVITRTENPWDAIDCELESESEEEEENETDLENDEESETEERNEMEEENETMEGSEDVGLFSTRHTPFQHMSHV